MSYLFNKIKALAFFAAASTIFFGCGGNESTPTKTISVYAAKKLGFSGADDHNMKSKDFSALVTSLNGELVYAFNTVAVKNPATTVLAKSLSSSNWEDPAAHYLWADGTQVIVKKDIWKSPNTKNLTSTRGGYGITPGHKNILLNEGIGDGKNTIMYRHDHSGLNKNDLRIGYAQKAGTDGFIYVAEQSGGKEKVLFRKYVAPTGIKDTAAWDGSLTKANGTALDDIFNAFAQKDQNGDLFLAGKKGIYALQNADIGEAGKFLGDPIYDIKDFSLDGTVANDQGITAMAALGDYLLVGFKSNSKDNGGLVIINLSNGTKTAVGAGLGLTINAITPLRHHNALKGKAAVIATDKGVLIFRDGKVIEPVAGKGILITDQSFADKPNKTFDSAKDGFEGDAFHVDALDIVGVGEDKNGLIYLMNKGKADEDGGIYTFDIKIETLTK